MKVSVIVPTLNEVGNIENILNNIARERIDELVVVDGYSQDGTIELVKRLGHRLILQEGKGLGKAIISGIKATSGEVIVIVDADGSHDPKYIPALIDKINKGYDVVVGSRYISGPEVKNLFFRNKYSSSYDDTFIRELGNRFFTYLCRKLYQLDIHDVLMGFKAFKRSILEKVVLNEEGQQFDAEILIKAKKAGFRIGEIPVIEHKRSYGKSKLSVPYHGFKVLSVIMQEFSPWELQRRANG
jgi:glycosyltransferase involved in cell wall biosynthesis